MTKGPSISHLFFADDSFLICEAYIDEVRVVKDIIGDYCMMSRQKVNFLINKLFVLVMELARNYIILLSLS